MSTTTVSYRSTARDAEIRALRRREAEARAAARRAAQRAEEQRRQEEAERRRREAANAVIAELEARFQGELTRLDEAARRLPDLTLRAPRLPTLGHGHANSGQLETYATQLRSEIDQFCRQLDAAIAEAERLLQRRLRLAAAWRVAGDLERQGEALVQISQEAADRLRESLMAAPPPARPGADAELETVERYLSTLNGWVEALRRQQASLKARIAAGERAAALSGPQVQARGAGEAHDRHTAERLAAAQARVRAHLETTLAAASLRLAELPAGLRTLIEDALAQAQRQDPGERITRWIARERQSREGIGRALTMLGAAPDLAHEDERLAARWTSLVARLQRIAGGLEPFTPDVEREYRQIQADSQRLVNTAFTRADWVKAMSDQGFEILERQDGPGLVVIDLDQPDIWLEATPFEAEEGGFAAQLELKSDATMSTDDARVTDAVCAKLARVAGAGTAEVQVEAEVIERKPRITRARRPARTQAQRL